MSKNPLHNYRGQLNGCHELKEEPQQAREPLAEEEILLRLTEVEQKHPGMIKRLIALIDEALLCTSEEWDLALGAFRAMRRRQAKESGIAPVTMNG